MEQKLVILLMLFVGLVSAQVTKKEFTLNDSTSLILRESPFDASQHEIVYKVKEQKTVKLIDGYLVYGTDAMLPQSKLDKATLILGKTKIDLDVSGMYDCHLEMMYDQFFSIESTFTGYRLRGIFSYAAGTFIAEWEVVDNQSFRTVISNNWEIRDLLFAKQLQDKKGEE